MLEQIQTFPKMYGLINSNFNRTYNPRSQKNILCDIKRLLTSRDTTAQNKACSYLLDVISKYNYNSKERSGIIQYLLDSDIIVFLCEATSNLDFSLFRTVLQCIRLLWHEISFFSDEHAAHTLTGITCALAHYTATDAFTAIDTCMHFICDLLTGIKSYKTTSPLSYQSAYSTEQLLACFTILTNKIRGKTKSILSSALVLHALIAYQPAELDIRGNTSKALVEVVAKWFELLIEESNHLVLVGVHGDLGLLLTVSCELGMDTLRLTRLLEKSTEPTDFIHKILKDEQEVSVLRQSSKTLRLSIQQVMNQLAIFIKDNLDVIGLEEYNLFLRTLLNYMYEYAKSDILPEFCDVLFSKGYLTMLPNTQVIRKDVAIRKLSTRVLGEILKILAIKYLTVKNNDNGSCIKDIHMGLVELQHGIENPQNIGLQLQNNQPYGLLIYIYFYCQSSENPEEATAPLLPYLIDHILRLPKLVNPPGYIIKALWLVFAMSTISYGSFESLEQRVYLEKATERLVSMLQPEPQIYYTHNPAILFWAFTSFRISNFIRLHVISQWLKIENTLPEDLLQESAVWELLLNVLIQSKDDTIIRNCMEALNICIQKGNETSKEEFATLVWSMLPEILCNALINYNEIEKNICYLLDIAIEEIPAEIDQSLYLKLATLITSLYTKNTSKSGDVNYIHYEFVRLKLCVLLLEISRKYNDDKVLLIYIKRTGFLPCVLTAITSTDDKVACTSVQLLTCIIFCFTKNNYQPNSVLEIQTDLIIKSLRQDSENERGVSLLQLIHIMLISGEHTPIVLTYDIKTNPSQTQQHNALRALMFRIQLMLCSWDSNNQSSYGWKTLNSIFEHAVVYKNDCNLVATLTSQPWTHTLIHFQLTQNTTQEFFTFAQNWLNLLKITIQKGREHTNYHIPKHSLIRKTLVMLKNKLKEGEFKNTNLNALATATEILEDK